MITARQLSAKYGRSEGEVSRVRLAVEEALDAVGVVDDVELEGELYFLVRSRRECMDCDFFENCKGDGEGTPAEAACPSFIQCYGDGFVFKKAEGGLE